MDEPREIWVLEAVDAQGKVSIKDMSWTRDAMDRIAKEYQHDTALLDAIGHHTFRVVRYVPEVIEDDL